MGNKRMRAEKRIFCKRQGLVDTRKLWRILYLVLTVSLFLTGCGQAADNDGTDILPERVQKDSVGQGESGKMADSGAEQEEDNAGSGEFSAEYAAEGVTKPDSGEKTDSIAVIRPDGEEIDWAVYSEGVYCYSSVTDFLSGTGLYGYLSEDGEEITPCIYSEAAPFSEGLGCALLDGKYGYIGEDGEMVLPFQYDQASPFREGVAYFSIGEEYGLIDREGNVVLELTDCDSISSFQEGLAYFSVDGRYGYMDKSGNVVIEPVYDDAGYFCGGLAVVMKGGFVAKNGQAEQQITASQCGGSMKGDRICFWYDTEKRALKPGTVGSYGGFGGMANGGEIYRLGHGKAVLENSYMHSSEIFADSEVRETYLVNDKAVSEEAYLAVESRYREYTPIGR